MSNGYIGFLCGIMVGLIIGIFFLAVILVANDARNRPGRIFNEMMNEHFEDLKKKEREEDNHD